MKLSLVKNGIFPITHDHLGNRIDQKLDTGLKISGTVQGEGKLMGVPSLFVRTSGCNLRCAWHNQESDKGSLCDTPYSSHRPEKNLMNVSDIIKTISINSMGGENGNINHIVISGGEPFIQRDSLLALVRGLKKEDNEIWDNVWMKDFHITVETNATIFDPEIAKYVDLFSLSPKLSNSIPYEKNLKDTGVEFNESWAIKHEKDRKKIKVIQDFIDFTLENPASDFQLKFVVSGKSDVDEIIDDYLENLIGWSNSDILLMPEGATAEDVSRNEKEIIQLCIKHGFRYCPRLHVQLWGDKRGV